MPNISDDGELMEIQGGITLPRAGLAICQDDGKCEGYACSEGQVAMLHHATSACLACDSFDMGWIQGSISIFSG